MCMPERRDIARGVNEYEVQGRQTVHRKGKLGVDRVDRQEC